MVAPWNWICWHAASSLSQCWWNYHGKASIWMDCCFIWCLHTILPWRQWRFLICKISRRAYLASTNNEFQWHWCKSPERHCWTCHSTNYSLGEGNATAFSDNVAKPNQNRFVALLHVTCCISLESHTNHDIISALLTKSQFPWKFSHTARTNICLKSHKPMTSEFQTRCFLCVIFENGFLWIHNLHFSSLSWLWTYQVYWMLEQDKTSFCLQLKL